MKRIRFLIPSLFAAGFGAHADTPALASGAPAAGDGNPDHASLFDLFKQGHAITLADHRSHSSHSSHRSGSGGGGGGGGHYSHTSHRSSAGGYGDYGTYSPPVYSSPAPSTPPQSSSRASGMLPLRSAQPGEATPPKTDSLPSLSGRTNRFKAIVKRVQIALLAQGYYEGAIDGAVGPGMRGAIRKLQAARSLPVTGTITTEVLDALRVSSQ